MEENVLGDASNALEGLESMSMEDIKSTVDAVKDDSEEIKVPEQPYIKFQTVDLLFNLKLFLSMNQSLQDILSRACLIEVKPVDQDNHVLATMSDGVFSGSVKLPYVELKAGFPETAVLDYESLMKVARFAGKYIYVVYEENTFYVDFYGGRVHLPNYTLNPDLIRSRIATAKVNQEVDLPVASFLRFMSIAESYLMSNEVPNLAFVFLNQDGMFLSNGYTVLKADFKFPISCSLRKLDIPFILAACKISMKYGIKISILDNGKMLISSPVVNMILPMVNEAFPNSYAQHLKNFNMNDYYSVDFSKFYMLLSVLTQVYRSSGVVNLKVDGQTLSLESRSLDEKMSQMVLARVDKVAEPKMLSFSVEGLLAVLRSIKNFDYLNVAIQGTSFTLFNEIIQLAVFGSTSGAKTEVFKLKKQCKRDEREKAKA